MDIVTIKRILEAALMASQHPLTLEQLGQLFVEEETLTHDTLAQAVLELQAENASRGVELVEVASGFRYQVQHDVYPWVSRLWTERQSKYSRALLETLALIAYRQPITRGEIEQIRGVVVSTSTIRTLEEREWVRVVGHRDMPGRPALFGTTKQFLDYFNLKSLDQLPPLSEIRDLAELEPQLEFDGPKPVSLPIEDADIPQLTKPEDADSDEAKSEMESASNSIDEALDIVATASEDILDNTDLVAANGDTELNDNNQNTAANRSNEEDV